MGEGGLVCKSLSWDSMVMSKMTKVISIHKHIPKTQGAILQVSASKLDPEQYLPPNDGGGLLHLLIRLWVPPPQRALQLVQVVQEDHLPSAKNIWKELNQFLILEASNLFLFNYKNLFQKNIKPIFLYSEKNTYWTSPAIACSCFKGIPSAIETTVWRSRLVTRSGMSLKTSSTRNRTYAPSGPVTPMPIYKVWIEVYIFHTTSNFIKNAILKHLFD